MGETRNLSKERRETLLKKIDELRVFFNTNEDINEKERNNLLNHLFDIEKEINNKKYGLVYEEHEEEIDRLLKTHIPVLTEDEKLYINNGGQMNFILEGDNLASLKLLEKTHKGKIDVIYIDPPYNIGNKSHRDFIYNDDFIKEDDTYKHSKWISFMKQRLNITKRLLTENGVIFISIDDTEQAQLKMLCDEIFDNTNFIAQIIWERAYSPVNLKKHFSESHDYILCFARNKLCAVNNGIPRSDDANARYSNPDNDPRGEWKSSDLSVGPAVKSNIYEIITPSGRKVLPPSGYSWRLSKEVFDEYKKDNRIWFGENGNNVPSIKRFLAEVKQGITPMTIFKYADVGHSQDATKELKEIFGGEAVFDYPKPVKLIKRLLELYSNKKSIVLDFFAGSGTTGQAVLELNKEDGGNRKFILCTNTEATEDEPKKNIARDITYQRMKTVITGKRKDKSKYSDGLAGSLKYMKIDYIDTQDKLYEDYQYELETHMKELLELQYGIDMNSSEEYKLLLTEDDKDDFCDKIIKNIDKYKKNNKLKKVFIGNDILFDIKLETLHEELGVEIVEIPSSYYEEI